MTREEKILLFESNSRYFSETKILEKDEKLYSEGDNCINLYYLKEGRINLFKNINHKKTYMWSALGPEIVGVTSFYNDNLLYSLSSIAAAPCVIFQIKVTDFKTIIESDSTLMTILFADLCKRIKFIHHQTQVYIHGSSKQKLINALLNKNIKSVLFIDGISIQEISDMSGVSIRYSLKILNELCERGLIRIINKIIFIKDPSGLKIVSKLKY